MLYELTIKNNLGETQFKTQSLSQESLEMELGRFERHFKKEAEEQENSALDKVMNRQDWQNPFDRMAVKKAEE